MKYYKPIDIPWRQASKELKNYIFLNFDISKCVSWTRTNTPDVLLNCPNLNNIAKILKTKISYVAFIIYHTHTQSLIHVDADNINKSRLILPVLNCEDSKTCFYTVKSKPEKKKQPNGVPFYQFNEKDCTFVDHFSVNDGLFLFRIKEPHNVVMPSSKTNFPRISCTFATTTDLTDLLN
jgi:hypothetical protein